MPPDATPVEGLSRREILSLAVPIMISNVSTPLLGLVDTAVVGHLPDPAYIGAVAMGALIFTFLFWGFGFLRMATTGLTSQAQGAGDTREVRMSLGRSVLLAVGLGLLLIVLQRPIELIAFALIEGSEHVEALARDFFRIRLWSAPATLVNYALLGWFIGLGRTRVALLLQLVLNLSNMLLDAGFVLLLHWDVRGVALGTVIAEYMAAAVGLVLASRQLQSLGGSWERAALFDVQLLARTLRIN
ncbi:MAG TPA: MATE family efflux transporter, partial [Polyangiaceae bacterium]|nr:MATE family efflux transporter [Polyangiaceae bacterium]